MLLSLLSLLLTLLLSLFGDWCCYCPCCYGHCWVSMWYSVSLSLLSLLMATVIVISLIVIAVIVNVIAVIVIIVMANSNGNTCNNPLLLAIVFFCHGCLSLCIGVHVSLFLFLPFTHGYWLFIIYCC